MRNVVSVFMVALMVIGAFSLTFNMHLIRAEPATIIVPDDYPTIQEALNHANAGDTVFVRNGTYYEHVCMNKTVSIVGQDKITTIIDGNHTGTVVTVTADNVNISGFTVQNGEAGLKLDGDCNSVTSSIFSSNGAVETDLKTGLEIYQDPLQPVPWYGIWDMMNGSYTEVMELTTDTPVLSLEVFSHSDVEALLLGVFFDENMDGAPQLHEFVGFGCVDKNPWTCLFGPSKGQYIIKIKGEAVTGNPGHFDRKITKHKGYGIGMHSCSKNTLSGNLISGNYAGLYVQSSSDMIVHSNNVTRNIGGIITENLTNSIFDSNRVFDNTPMTYSTGISMRAAENVSLSRNVVSQNCFGITIWNSTNTNVENNEIISNHGWGVELHASLKNRVADNCISDVGGLNGIFLRFSSGNILSGNNITKCEHSGITLSNDCDNNTVTYNNIQLTGSHGIIPGHGVEIILSHNNTFSNNVISHGVNQGMLVIESPDNTITANLVSSNPKGIVLWDSIRNRIYHNNIIDNWEQQAFDDTGENTWDDGYPSGGNYWSDYDGNDLRNGSYQNETGSDGIGDSPYVFDENYQDAYPLMKPHPWGSHDIGITNLYVSKTVVGQGYALYISVMMFNYGNNTEYFNITVFVSTTVIHTFENVELPGRNSTTLTFVWNPTGFFKGSHTLHAIADTVSGETDDEDNTLMDGNVIVTIPGDVDGDFDVDIFDVVKITSIYASKQGDPRFSPNSDIDGDGVITIFDVVICTSQYGQKYP